MLKIRLGAVPETEVKIPHPPVQVVPSVRRSSQCGCKLGPCVAEGKQAFVNAVFDVTNCRLPLEMAFTEVYDCPYRVNGKGMAMATEQSSQALPVLTVPGTIVPVAVA